MSLENDQMPPQKETSGASPTGMVHVFPSRIEFIKIKSMEISVQPLLLVTALRKNVIELTEPCRSRMCGAPSSAHKLSA